MATMNKNQLIKLQKKHITDDAIGKVFGISRQAVHQLRNKYGIPAIVNKKAPRNAAIAKAFENNIPCETIAKKFKLSPAQIYRIIRENTK
jgi:Mor family transcriptional regulator